MTAVKLTDAKREILTYVAGGQRRGPSGVGSAWVVRSAYHSAPYHDRPGIWAALVRAGLLKTQKQSEQVRGERRTYWTEYMITEAGRSALQEASHD